MNYNTADAQTGEPAASPEVRGAPEPLAAVPAPSPGLRPVVAYVSSDTDPHSLGARVVEPLRDSKQAVRGSLYAIVELSGGPAPADVTERLLSLLQRTYYTARGSQSAVLGEAVRSALSVVSEYNALNPTAQLRVSLACATMLQKRLLLACCGAAFAMLRAGERIELYPDQPTRALPRNPDEGAAVEVLKWELAAGDVVLLCGPAWSDRLPVKTLAATVYYVTADTSEVAAAGLREQAGGSVGPGLLLVLQPEAPPQAQRAPSPLTAPRRSAPAGLPTSFSAAPPVAAPASEEPASTSPYAPPPLGAATAAHVDADQTSDIPAFLRRSEIAAGLSLATPTAPTAGTPATNFEPFPTLAVQAAAGSDIPASSSDAKPEPGATGDVVSTTDRMRASARENADRARLFFRQMLPEKRTPNPADFELLENEIDDSSAGLEPGDAAQVSGAAASVAAPAMPPPAVLPAPEFETVEQPPFEPPAAARGSRARLFITLAILIALLVPVTVAAYYWRVGASLRAEAEMLVSLAQARITSAQDSLNAADMRTSLSLVSEAQDYIDRSVELVGPTQGSGDLSAQVRRIQQESSNTKLLYGLTSPLIVFPEGAAPTRLLVVDQDVYVLDPGRGLVERYRLDDTLDQLADPNGAPVLTTGQSLDGAVVGDLIDMAWQPVVPGYDDKATLLVLDSNNQIYRYDPRVEGPSRLKMGGAADFKSLRQLETFNRRLYVADAGRGQVLRYPEGRYDQEPSEWFAAPVNLDEMKTMRIDGDLWIMLKNGQILRFFGGEQVPFSLDNSVGLVREPVDFTIGDGTNPYIYVADRSGERIWVFDRDGKYSKQFAAPEGNPLRGLSAISIEDVTDSLFLLTPKALYKHPLPTD